MNNNLLLKEVPEQWKVEVDTSSENIKWIKQSIAEKVVDIQNSISEQNKQKVINFSQKSWLYRFMNLRESKEIQKIYMKKSKELKNYIKDNINSIQEEAIFESLGRYQKELSFHKHVVNTINDQYCFRTKGEFVRYEGEFKLKWGMNLDDEKVLPQTVILYAISYGLINKKWLQGYLNIPNHIAETTLTNKQMKQEIIKLASKKIQEIEKKIQEIEKL